MPQQSTQGSWALAGTTSAFFAQRFIFPWAEDPKALQP
jgi:hypothetical protein